jgi:hypothetical protein
MCLIAWLILGLIGGWFVASQGVNNSGASDFRPPPPRILWQPDNSHSHPRQNHNLPDCRQFYMPCARGRSQHVRSGRPPIAGPRDGRPLPRLPAEGRQIEARSE